MEDQLVVPAGEHRFREGSLRYQSARRRDLSAGAELSAGGFFGGRRTGLGGNVRWNPNARVTLQTEAETNALTLAGETATANLFSFRARLAYSPRLYTGSFVQYNQAQDPLVSNLRLTVYHAPLSEAFLVVTERRDLRSGAPAPERFVSLKVTRLLQF